MKFDMLGIASLLSGPMNALDSGEQKPANSNRELMPINCCKTCRKMKQGAFARELLLTHTDYDDWWGLVFKRSTAVVGAAILRIYFRSCNRTARENI